MAKSREAFRTISEVADWLGVQTHVLRFWESKFSQVKPVKRAGGRRYYRPQDMELLGGIKKLLHEDGMPIKDAQKLLREMGVKHVSSLSQPVDQDAPDAKGADIEETVQHESAEPHADATEASGETEQPPTLAGTEDASPDAEDDSESFAQTEATFASVESQADDAPQDEQQPPIESQHDLPPSADEQPSEEPEQADSAADSQGSTPLFRSVSSSDAQPHVAPETEAVTASESSEPVQEDVTQQQDNAPTGDLFDSLQEQEPLDAQPASEQAEALPAAATLTEKSEDAAPNLQTEAPVSQEEAPTNTAEHPSDPADALRSSGRSVASLQSGFESAASNSEQTLSQSAEAPTQEVVKPSSGVSGTPAQTAPEETATPSAPASPPTAKTAVPGPAKMSEEEDSKDAFLRVFTQNVHIAPQNQSRAAELLAKLEALQARAS
ncbi:MerR family transcriptional regulator [Shimia sp. MMG029]|uniref:MerR family transcriptional regulator n=1 Tax=Shimia sp. MMG029 TaxID=3021978 RepID=UPI0022FE8B8F|nr:MerR family transcriptional regulator [Shimia sp. MMG029]MDA5555406.1 MerR family transcriptional regulator [Shimia sp. MMG029]